MDENNLLHQCITGKDWYIHAVTVYPKQGLKHKHKK